MKDDIARMTPAEVSALAAFMLRMARPAFPSVLAEPQFLARRMPTLSTEIPLPDDAETIGSLIYGEVTTIIFDTTMAPGRVREFYSERLPVAGWRALERDPRPVGGFFAPHPLLPPDCFVHDKHDLILQVTPHPQGEIMQQDGPSDVRLTLNSNANSPLYKMRIHQGRNAPVLPPIIAPDNAI